ncbi:MAG: hypothetical protein A2Y21_09695 [Clostridiales bacterium GWC2_40_7]|nr:MAG: hypothetical protein A2Y21_09695 [Clostridiales bacterium GWC2_40_7]
MKRRNLSFEEIDPYIRYPHLFKVERDFPLSCRAAYDYRLIYIYDGTGCVIIDNAKYEAVKGNLFIWRPGIPYSLHPGTESGLTIIGINFDYTHSSSKISYPIPPENIEIFDEEKITEIIQFNDLEAFNGLIFLKSMQSFESLLFDIINEFTMHKRFFMQKARGHFLSMLADIARHATSTFTDKEGINHKVDLMLDYIRENYARPITNKEVAEHFNFHPVYINRLIVKYTGMSLHQYLIDYRISMAINLLQNSGKSVTEIAYEVGFKDMNYFSRYFKKNVGMSPRNYFRKVDCLKLLIAHS